MNRPATSPGPNLVLLLLLNSTGADGAYRSVKSLLSKAQLKPGDVVDIHPGTYVEAIGLAKIAGTTDADAKGRHPGRYRCARV